MNLYFLVEGRRTEKRVYARWLAHVFPALSQVERFADVASDHYLIVSGGGQPAILDEIGAALATICERPVIDHLFICLDAEDEDLTAKRAELDAEITRRRHDVGADARAPALRIHAVIQNCCIETWFLGHRKVMKAQPSTSELARYKAFYDVRTADPEAMPSIEQTMPRAVFHGQYLRAMLAERSPEPRFRYSKRNPGVVTDHDYLAALGRRCRDTGHLPSLAGLLDTWHALGGVPDLVG
ncbi:hypothetical protein [Haliangium sp.]|uniref:hypothetical protein n=1 Tax=Haliangium sp. TaxID=2663208 RepID=UPI003D0BFA18